jgi:hypothetical protein
MVISSTIVSVLHQPGCQRAISLIRRRRPAIDSMIRAGIVGMGPAPAWATRGEGRRGEAAGHGWATLVNRARSGGASPSARTHDPPSKVNPFLRHMARRGWSRARGPHRRRPAGPGRWRRIGPGRVRSVYLAASPTRPRALRAMPIAAPNSGPAAVADAVTVAFAVGRGTGARGTAARGLRRAWEPPADQRPGDQDNCRCSARLVMLRRPIIPRRRLVLFTGTSRR